MLILRQEERKAFRKANISVQKRGNSIAFALIFRKFISLMYWWIHTARSSIAKKYWIQQLQTLYFLLPLNATS